MLYYVIAILLFLVAVFVTFQPQEMPQKSLIVLKKTSYYSFLLLLILLGGFRWLTGTDWDNYYDFFFAGNSYSDFAHYRYEFLFTLLNFVIFKVFASYTAFLLVFHFLTISIKGKVIESIAIYPFLTLFLYYCTNIGDIVAVRQQLSISILFISIIFIDRKDQLRFILLVCIASLFHYSSIIFIFAYSIYHAKWSNLKIIIILSICFIIGLFGKLLYPTILQFFLRLFNISGIVTEKILFYSTTKSGNIAVPQLVAGLLKRSLLIPFYIVFRNRLRNVNHYMNGLLNLYFFGNGIYFLFITTFGTFGRLAVPFVLLEIFILPVMLKLINRKSVKYIFLILFLLYGLLKLWVAMYAFVKVLVPYQSVFNYIDRPMN